MSDLHEELRQLAEQVAACPDDTVGDIGAEIARQYRERRAVLEALLNVNAMVVGEGEISQEHPQFVALHEDLRDRLRKLVAWARGAGRM